MTDRETPLEEIIEGTVTEILLAISDVGLGDFSSEVPVPDEEGPLAALCIGINEMLQALRDRQAALDESQQKLEVLSSQSMMGLAVVKDSRVRYANQSFADLTEYSLEEIESWEPGQGLEKLFGEGHVAEEDFIAWNGEKVLTTRRGTRRWVEIFASPVTYEGGDALYLTLADITERKEAQEVIQHQNEAIRELSTPILKIWDRVLALPVIGVVDTQRSSEIMERLLSEIRSQQARYVIVDITGVEVVDTKTADHFIKLVKAAQLLGSHCILTGIRPAVAQTLVEIGVEMKDVTTRSNLSQGLIECMRLMRMAELKASRRRANRVSRTGSGAPERSSGDEE